MFENFKPEERLLVYAVLAFGSIALVYWIYAFAELIAATDFGF